MQNKSPKTHQPRFIISGGGTGGHIYPALAIAHKLMATYPKADILFVGAKDKMEMQKVPQAGFPIEGLWIAGLQRKLTFKNALFPIKLIASLWRSRSIIKKFKPDVVIGTGGFASGPLLQMAQRLGIPTVIQEQNSYPGITNKMLAAKAQSICVAYDQMDRFFPKDKIQLTGNPVRQDIADLPLKTIDAYTYFLLDPTKKTVLVLGGSLGARAINQLIEKELDYMLNLGYQVFWQCGKLYFDQYQHLAERDGVHLVSFIDRMDLIYSVADLIISRAGASTVSELALVGKPVIFIPSPNVAEDHQRKNAQAIVDREGAVMILEKELDQTFEPVFLHLSQQESLQRSLGQHFKKMARPNATDLIVKEICKLIPHRES
ncbi:MAG: undecaprenyldiphospho-muramoylpentapeptide beta-N-acetylglucosaminyltransferase [Flavobacterium sp. BFFFF2]|nr:MAG: undecaprenyldiphospho-muramoylpentapeptide beta-N-acetylglucosaminyltransferase [Flavobacterium sp. BFFFF2]